MDAEKREKLAAARKKLNEFKQNRASVKSSSTTLSSKPADVPQFYQNLNAPASTLQIFNPGAAAGDNNNVSTASSYFNQPYVPSSSPTPPVFSDEKTQPAGNAFKQPDTTFHSPYSDENYYRAHPLPNQFITPSPPVLEAVPVEPSVFNLLPTQFATVAETSPTLPTEDTTKGIDEQAKAHEKAAVFEENLLGFENSSKDETKELNQDFQKHFGGNEYQPSAPPLDSGTVPVISNIFGLPNEQVSVGAASSDLSDKLELTPDTSTARLARTSESDSSVQLFASSIFGSAGNDNSLDKIFNVNDMSSPLVFPTPLTENETANSEIIPEKRTPEVPQENLLFSPVNDLSKDMEMMPHPFCASASEIPEVLPSLAFPNSEDTFDNQYQSNIDSTVQNISTSEIMSSMNQDIGELDNSLVQESNNKGYSFAPRESTPTDDPKRNNEFNQEESADFVQSKPNRSSSNEIEICRMRSVQEALELQIEELRRENEYLLGRQTELNSKIEESERLAHEFKLDRDRIKEESMANSQALRARINSLCEENQRIVKNSTEVGVDIRKMLEEKTRQLEEMQQAVIIVSQSKMDFAGKLDNELEKVKLLQNTITEKDEEINSLRGANAELQEKVKHEQQKDAMIHQLHEQTKSYKFQNENLHKELFMLTRKTKDEMEGRPHGQSEGLSHGHHDGHTPDTDENTHNHHAHVHTTSLETSDKASDEKGDSNVHHHDSETCTDHDHHHHQHDHGDHHHHEHGDHDHHHDHFGHSHNHDHEGEERSNVDIVAMRGPSDEVTELKKTLHRLQWENSSFRSEIDNLAVDAKQKKSYEDKCTALEEENQRLRKEVEQLEHVVIQLQGENDTIGDYVTLYQTQKLALKECAKEKDAQLELLAREREMLLHRLTELTALVQDLRDSKSESGSQCADDHVHSMESSLAVPHGHKKRQIEGQIRDLLTEIGSSSLIENFHPCAVCSGRLMTV